MTNPSPEIVLTSLPGGPMGVLDYLGTENANDEPSREFAQRRSRCYELAGVAILSGSLLVERARLVHGSWKHRDAPERIGHAWLQVPTTQRGQLLIWEPITAGLYQEVDFMTYTQAWDEVTYNVRQARAHALESGHFGRWHESRYP